jgi:hypothetical protein
MQVVDWSRKARQKRPDRVIIEYALPRNAKVWNGIRRMEITTIGYPELR